MEAAVPLVKLEENDEHSLKVSDNALMKIQKLPTTYGIKTIAIVGSGRIGKSSLLNWLVGKNVFEIGSTTQRVTKGIWMYIDQNDDTQMANIYLDVEGFGDPSKSNVHENDNRLLNIVTQICDVVMYNIKGVYDSDMRDKIKFVCTLFQRYRKMNAVLEKPILVSVLRDFHLDFPECADTEFRVLFERNPNILDTFRETKAFTLLKPKEGKVGELTNIPDAELDDQFVKERNKLKNYLTANVKPLRATPHKFITGIVLAENIKRTVQYVNDEDLRMLSKSLTMIFREKNDAIKESALGTYRAEMSENWPLPSQPETLMQLHDRKKEAALEHIERYCFIIEGSVEIDKEAIMNAIESIFKDIQHHKCQDARQRVVCEILHKFEREEYFERGGSERFFEDYHNAEKSYKEMKNLGTEKLGVWETFNKEMETIKELIKGRAKLIETELAAAALQMENRELNERLELERQEFENKIKEIENRAARDQLRQWTLGIGQLLIDGADRYMQNRILRQGAVNPLQTRTGGAGYSSPLPVDGGRSASPIQSMQGGRSVSPIQSMQGARSSSPIPIDGARSASPILSMQGARSSSPTLSLRDTEV